MSEGLQVIWYALWPGQVLLAVLGLVVVGVRLIGRYQGVPPLSMTAFRLLFELVVRRPTVAVGLVIWCRWVASAHRIRGRLYGAETLPRWVIWLLEAVVWQQTIDEAPVEGRARILGYVFDCLVPCGWQEGRIDNVEPTIATRALWYAAARATLEGDPTRYDEAREAVTEACSTLDPNAPACRVADWAAALIRRDERAAAACADGMSMTRDPAWPGWQARATTWLDHHHRREDWHALIAAGEALLPQASDPLCCRSIFTRLAVAYGWLASAAEHEDLPCRRLYRSRAALHAAAASDCGLVAGPSAIEIPSSGGSDGR